MTPQPVQIVFDGTRWLAGTGHTPLVSSAALGDPEARRRFDDSVNADRVGTGSTPNKAAADLEKRWTEAGMPLTWDWDRGDEEMFDTIRVAVGKSRVHAQRLARFAAELQDQAVDDLIGDDDKGVLGGLGIGRR